MIETNDYCIIDGEYSHGRFLKKILCGFTESHTLPPNDVID
jgi:hypothetical protein